MIRGIVYLTGLLTLGVIAVSVGTAYEVQKWPWRDYIDRGRDLLAEQLDPRPRTEADARPVPAETVPSAQPQPETPERTDDGLSACARPHAQAGAVTAVRHTVRRGETLYQIAERYYGRGEGWPQIAAANDIRRPADLRVGEVILVPFGEEPRGTPGAWAPSPRLSISPAFEP